MATYHAARDGAAERHIMTLALLDGVAGLLLSLFAVWLIWGARLASVDDEALLSLSLGAICLGLAVLNAGLFYGLRRFSSTARVIQIVAAILALPLIPIGTFWGLYALWTLLHRTGRVVFTPDAAFRRREVARRMPQPYYAIVIAAVTVCSGLMSYSMLRGRELWLARKVELAAAREASQKAAVGRSMQRLRDLSADDLARDHVRKEDLPAADERPKDDAPESGSAHGELH
jgi:hypothetical protein